MLQHLDRQRRDGLSSASVYPNILSQSEERHWTAVTVELAMLTNHHHHSKALIRCLSSFGISNVKLHISIMAQHIICNDLFMSTEPRMGLPVRSFSFLVGRGKPESSTKQQEKKEKKEKKTKKKRENNRQQKAHPSKRQPKQHLIFPGNTRPYDQGKSPSVSPLSDSDSDHRTHHKTTRKAVRRRV